MIFKNNYILFHHVGGPSFITFFVQNVDGVWFLNIFDNSSINFYNYSTVYYNYQ